MQVTVLSWKQNESLHLKPHKLEDFLGFKINSCQDNESKSSKGVLRESVLDVAVDIRDGTKY